MVASHGEWSLTLDTYVVNAGKTVLVFTRMRAPYVNPNGFRFSVSRAGLFTGIAKRLGMQDGAVGHEDFDRELVIKGNSEETLRALFTSSRLRERIGAQKDIHFSVDHDSGWFRPEPPPAVDTLGFHVTGVITDIERLKLLFDLFSTTLDDALSHRVRVRGCPRHGRHVARTPRPCSTAAAPARRRCSHRDGPRAAACPETPAP